MIGKKPLLLFICFFALSSCKEKNASIKDTQEIEVPQEKTGLNKFNPFSKPVKETLIKELNIDDNLTIEIPFKLEYEKLNLALLVNNFSHFDKEFFKEEAGTKSNPPLEYIAIFSNIGEDKLIGSNDVTNKTITFEMLNTNIKNISGRAYDDLGVIFGSAGENPQEYFTEYRGSFAIDGNLIIKNLTDKEEEEEDSLQE